MSRVTILGVPIDAISMPQVLAAIHHMLEGSAQHHVMTPNSEMLVAATRNPAFRQVLQQSSLNIPDSSGLLKMGDYLGEHIPERVTGVDTVMQLCANLSSNHPVFLLGGAPGIAEKAAAALLKNPRLAIAGTYGGSPHEEDEHVILTRIKQSQPHLLLVAFGAPQQDLWIHKHLSDLPSVRVAIGVGGTFDFLAGKRKRAPQWMQRLGLEWLWRLLCEPRRIGRILNAVIIFPLLTLRYGKDGPPTASGL